MAEKKNEKTEKKTKEPAPKIPPLRMEKVSITIQGEAPLCIHKFGAKVKEKIKGAQEAAEAKSSKTRSPKDFEEAFNDARHISEDGWDGIHAAAFRNAAISACKITGYVMTKAKLSIFIVPEGFDAEDGSPLVRIISEEPKNWIAPVRLDSGAADLRARPLYREWGAVVNVRYDADQFGKMDVINLFTRVGAQVGVGEGRPDSKKSAGIGFGLFSIVSY